MEVDIIDGQVTVASSMGKGPLKPTGEPDKYAGDQGTSFQFIRKNGKVTALKLMPPGMNLEGIKQ